MPWLPDDLDGETTVVASEGLTILSFVDDSIASFVPNMSFDSDLDSPLRIAAYARIIDGVVEEIFDVEPETVDGGDNQENQVPLTGSFIIDRGIEHRMTAGNTVAGAPYLRVDEHPVDIQDEEVAIATGQDGYPCQYVNSNDFDTVSEAQWAIIRPAWSKYKRSKDALRDLLDDYPVCPHRRASSRKVDFLFWKGENAKTIRFYRRFSLVFWLSLTLILVVISVSLNGILAAKVAHHCKVVPVVYVGGHGQQVVNVPVATINTAVNSTVLTDLRKNIKERIAVHSEIMGVLLGSIENNLQTVVQSLDTASEEMAFIRGITTTNAAGKGECGAECADRIGSYLETHDLVLGAGKEQLLDNLKELDMELNAHSRFLSAVEQQLLHIAKGLEMERVDNPTLANTPEQKPFTDGVRVTRGLAIEHVKHPTFPYTPKHKSYTDGLRLQDDSSVSVGV